MNLCRAGRVTLDNFIPKKDFYRSSTFTDHHAVLFNVVVNLLIHLIELESIMV